MQFKPQDLLVLLKVAAHPTRRWTYAALGTALSMSASEVHASVRRAVHSGLAVAPGEAPVWAHPAGGAKGPAWSPLYRTAAQAALADPALHRLLALLDALRAGPARERMLAIRFMQAALTT